jgi:hypothetical protein
MALQNCDHVNALPEPRPKAKERPGRALDKAFHMIAKGPASA